MTWKIYNVFNEVLLTPYCTPSFLSQQKLSPPLPKIINNEPEYIVEKILDAKLVWGHVKYLVKWEGYSDEYNSWEPMSDVANAKQKVKEYHDIHPNFSRLIGIMQFRINLPYELQ